MNRRDLLQSLAGLPFVKLAFKMRTGNWNDDGTPILRDTTVDAVKVGDGENGKYVVFYDIRSIDPNGFGANPLDEHDPLTRSEWVPVYLRQGQTVQDVVAIYKIDGQKAV